MTGLRRFVALTISSIVLTSAPLEARQQAAPAPTQNTRQAHADDHDHNHRPVQDGQFMGRPIADVMSFMGADWLMRDSRVREEQPERMLDALEIQPGMTVADVGSGVGYHSLRLADRVGPDGLVYATDVQPQMLRMLVDRVEKAGINNVIPVLCTQNYTGLPPNSVDLILMVDVYHEISDPDSALLGFKKALKPGGRLVLVEFRAEDPRVPIKPEHKMTVDQVRLEVEPLGLQFQKLHDFLPWQHIIIFQKPPTLPSP